MPTRSHLALALYALLSSGALHAQQSPGDSGAAPADQAKTAEGKSDAKTLDRVSIVGSQIAGGGAQAALPVVGVDKEQIDSTGAGNGDQLFRNLPQFGDVAFTQKVVNEGRNQNYARGDVASINLRNIGSQYTLLLVDGRRTIAYPLSGNTPSYNANAIPTFGLDRMDVLLDGAAAVYGSDAVAGVVNLVLPSNLNGGGVKVGYGHAEGTHRSNDSIDGYWGRDFGGGRGNVSVLYGVSHQSAQLNSDQWYTATDRRSISADGNAVPDPNGTAAGLSSYTPWGQFQLVKKSDDGTVSTVGSPYYVDATGALKQGALPTSLKYDIARTPGVTQEPKINRGNFFANAHYDLTDSLQLFGELSYYRAKSDTWFGSDPDSVLSSTVPNFVYIDPNAYWVPAALKAAAAAAGATAIRLSNYNLADAPLRKLTDDNSEVRALAGLRGWTDSGWNWETALLYSRARTVDSQESGLFNEFVAALNGTTASAYNPFNGGDPAHPSYGDATPSDISGIVGWATRVATNTLGTWDFKVNRPDAVRWYAGDIGVAAGVELRHETAHDDRDPNVDGTLQYTDWYTGNVNSSNIFLTSYSDDIDASRTVKSVFAELAVPLVSPDLGIPLVKSLDLQIAGRYEDYSDAGSVAKPKFALAWNVSDSLLLRGSVSGGFHAPALELANSGTIWRGGSTLDLIRCDALVSSGAYAKYNTCVTANTGNALFSPTVDTGTTYNKNDVKPETSKQYSYGFVFEPKFLPEAAGKFSIGVNAWQIKVENPITSLGTTNELLYDAYLRFTGQGSNPNVIRAAASAADIAQFAGSGVSSDLVPGTLLNVLTNYVNGQPLTAKGIDYDLSWRKRDTAWGNWSFIVNVSQLKSYTQTPLPEVQTVAKAIASGQLVESVDPATLAAYNLVGLNGAKPEWRGSAALIWNYADWTVRVRDNYIGSVTSSAYSYVAVTAPQKVDSTQLWTLSLKKDFSHDFFKGGYVEAGARNLFDKQPPLDAGGNYLAALYEDYGRYLYLNIGSNW